MPSKPLRAATDYTLAVRPGMRSPLGPLPGEQAESLAGITTYGDFDVRGVGCNRDQVQITPGETDPPRCIPSDVNLLFSAPVPRATLAAIRWKPMPLPHEKLAARWRDYPQWFLRGRRDRLRVAQIGLHRADLADPAERLQMEGEVRPAHRHPDAVVAPGQRTDNVATEEAGAAVDGDKGVVRTACGHAALASHKEGPGCVGPLRQYRIAPGLYRLPRRRKRFN